LTQSVLQKVNEIGMKEDYEENDSLRLAIRCIPALAMVPSSDVTETFLIQAGHEKMPQLLPFFENTHI